MGLFNKKNKTPTISKQKAFMFFTTVADIGSLCIALIYITYVSLSLYLGFGTPWLNFVMLGITVLYIGFFLFKLFYLNRTMLQTAKVKKIVKKANKYTKLGMRMINAAFVVLSLIGVQLGESHALALVGILIVGVTFIVSILWDIGNFIVKRKIRDFMVAWNNLNQDEKAERIELVMSGFMRGLDNVVAFDEYLDVGMSVKRMMGNKWSDRIRLADARRIDPYGESNTDGEGL